MHAKPLHPPRGNSIVGATCVIGLLLVAVCAVLHMTPAKLLLAAHGHLPAIDRLLLARFRVPRLLMAAMVGSGMAVAGWAAQKATRNPLASPDILAVPAAAALGVTIVFWLAGGQILGLYTIPLAAAGSGMLASVLLFTLVGRRRQLDGSGFLLVGVALGALLAATNFMIELTIPPGAENQSRGAAFMSGQLMRASMPYVWLLLPAWWLLMLGIAASSGHLAVLQLDDEIVTQLGGQTRRWRRVGLCLSGALCAVCVGVAGGFGFIGFVAPHVARAMGRDRTPWLCALIGAVLLISADAIGQFILWPDQVPAGSVVALLGGPMFLFFMFRRRLISTG